MEGITMGKSALFDKKLPQAAADSLKHAYCGFFKHPLSSEIKDVRNREELKSMCDCLDKEVNPETIKPFAKP
jgi:hypothetical protein